MRIAFITRSTLFEDPGGDTVQIVETARQLKELGVEIDILKTNDPISYDNYVLLHFFNLTRPADMLYHIEKSNKPFVVSPIMVDYAEYDRQHRKGFSGALLRLFPANMNEYIKTVARWVVGKDVLQSKSYLLNGQGKSIQTILQKTCALLPNSAGEYSQIRNQYNIETPWYNVPNGVDNNLFSGAGGLERQPNLVLCVGRIEGRKNQLALIRALNNSKYQLIIIGAAAPNQRRYLEQCKKEAAANIQFIDRVPQEALIEYYTRAKVHVLASWFETTGLSNLEAAAMGCNIVITDKGFARDYFGDDAFYCDPSSPASILDAVERAAAAPTNVTLQNKVATEFTWQKAALETLKAYQAVLGTSKPTHSTSINS